MQFPLHNQQGEKIGVVDLPDRLFNVPFNADVVHQAVVAQMANSRLHLAHVKTRAEVRGGGRKPWRQKGTGRARHGSRRSPIWVGGGVAHGPQKERVFAKKINKKVRQKALAMALTAKLRDSQIGVLDDLQLSAPKTKQASTALKIISSKIFQNFPETPKPSAFLLVLSHKDPLLLRALRNIPFVRVIYADSLNAKDILQYHYTLFLKDSVEIMDKTYHPG